MVRCITCRRPAGLAPQVPIERFGNICGTARYSRSEPATITCRSPIQTGRYACNSKHRGLGTWLTGQSSPVIFRVKPMCSDRAADFMYFLLAKVGLFGSH